MQEHQSPGNCVSEDNPEPTNLQFPELCLELLDVRDRLEANAPRLRQPLELKADLRTVLGALCLDELANRRPPTTYASVEAEIVAFHYPFSPRITIAFLL